MKRKLVQQGASTLMISLPNRWVKSNSLQKGKEVLIEERCNALTISNIDGDERTTTISFSNVTESSIRTLIVNAYRLGYNTINLKGVNQHQMETVRNVLGNYLIGLEIVEDSSPNYTLSVVSEPSGRKFSVFIKNIFSNIELLIKGTQYRISQGSNFPEHKELSSKIHQYDNCCRRLMVKQRISNSEAEAYWSFLSLMVHGQRELYLLNRYLDKSKVVYSEQLPFEGLKEILSLLKKGYFSKDVSSLEDVHKLEKEYIYNWAYDKLDSGKDGVAVHRLASAIRTFYLAASPLMGMILEPSCIKEQIS